MQNRRKMVFDNLRTNEIENHPTSDNYPQLYTISAGFFYQSIPIPYKREIPEFVYLPVPLKINQKMVDKTYLSMTEWNLAWESGQLRYEAFSDDLPKPLEWLKNYEDHNLYLLPQLPMNKYPAYTPLFHLLPIHIIKKYHLPYLKKGNWPYMGMWWKNESNLPKAFNDSFSMAFGEYIFPFLNSQSNIFSFGQSEPIKLLAHNLDFWLPYITQTIESHLQRYSRCEFESEAQRKTIIRENGLIPNEAQMMMNRPLTGGHIWCGEEETKEFTKEMIEVADKNGNLRAIIDAINSNRIEDDFSNRWSYAKEDFERKMYKKRSKIKVTFVELQETIPVQGPDSEVEDNLVWEDFFTILNKKERRVIVCLRNGITKVGEISTELGYANHSPISKTLAKIRMKALNYFED